MAYETFQIDKRINKVYKLEKKVTKKRNKEKSKLEKKVTKKRNKVTKKRNKEKKQRKECFLNFFRIFYILLIYFSYSQSSYELYNTKEKSL